VKETRLIDRYIDALRRDPAAKSPRGLDPQIAAFVRAVVLAEREPDPDPATLNRIWARVLADVQGKPVSLNPQPSANGHDPDSHDLLSRAGSPRRPAGRWRWVRGLAAIITAILCAGLLILALYPTAGSDPQTVYLAERNRIVLERLFLEVWNSGQVDTLGDILAPDYVHHTPGLPDIAGIDAITQVITDFHAALPGAQFTDIKYISNEDKQFEFTLTGDVFQPDPLILPNGLHLDPTRDLDTFEIEVTAKFNDDGQITELWTQPDGVGLWLQLVALPVPSPYPLAQRESESAHIDTVLQLEKLLDSSAEDADFDPLIDPALVGTLQPNIPPSLPIGAERIAARDDLVAVQALLRDDAAQPAPVWSEAITIYRFDEGRIVELWRFYYRTFTAAP
jgi:predicted SnoaL-like aldol condensation-catalyzing enzyme